jgi:hypothetical protein
MLSTLVTPQSDSLRSVAQSCTLLYRRFSICRVGNKLRSACFGRMPIANRRYSRVQLCATNRALLARRCSMASLAVHCRIAPSLGC